MADFTSDFWNIYVALLTILGIVGCGVLLWSQSTHKVSALKSVDGHVGTTGHIWDEDLTELNTPMPRWWMWLFYLTIVFGVGYLALYPGLGSYAGKLGWNSTGEYKQELAKAESQYGPLFARYQQQDLRAVAADPQAHAMGERLFLTYCAQCHGSDARGNKGFPNLTDKDWLHGGAPETIKETIMKGRHGVMPSMAAAVGSDKDIENVAHYVLSLSDSTSDPIKTVMGKSKFSACMACHGAGGKGNQALGAPNLSDKIWLYGGSAETIMETIRKGRDNTMPAFGDFLGEGKVHVLAAYVWSLSNPPAVATKMNAPAPKVIKMYAASEDIYPREVKGRYTSLRWLCLWLTQLVFYGTAWLTWNDRQALLFDLAARKFYIFGLVLWPQDFIYLAALLIACAWGLFLVTAVAGRVWCGYSCPQTVYTEMFLWIERKFEGSRSAQMRLKKASWGFDKVWRKGGKHIAWLALALWTGFTFVGYFTPIRSLAHEALTLNFGPWEWFWVVFYSFATYGNAGWMREQVCKYMCPYARFQSAMFDRDTLIITYDEKRGEPRGRDTSGSCIDCSLCVQVCPTGIDIRKGLQYECIGCAACIDACDMVMDKTGQPRGLIRYDTDRAIHGGGHARILRPRVMIYTAALTLFICAVFAALWMRTPLKVDVIRDRGSMGREVEDGMIENVYRLQIMNTSEQGHSYRIRASGIDGLAVVTEDVATLAATETRAVPVRLRVPHGAGERGSNKITFELTATDDPSLSVRESAVFIVPRR